MNANFVRFEAPVLGQETQAMYRTLYGEAGESFLDILNTSPEEIAVISILIAYLRIQKGGEPRGYSENSAGDRAV